MRIGVAIGRAGSVDATFTTVHLARAALRRGDSVSLIEANDFEVPPGGGLRARAHAFDPVAVPSADAMVAALRDRTAPRRFVDVDKLDLLLLRAAPLDAGILAFASIAKEFGVRVVNDPLGALAVSHKGWLASQRGVPTPPTVVTQSMGVAQAFAADLRAPVVVKPARGQGGHAVSLVTADDPGPFERAFVEAIAAGDGYVVVQAYLPEAEHGEKRLVWLDGRVLGGYLRRRAPGEFRHNLNRGAVAESTEMTAAESRAVAALSPALGRAGIRLAGLDLIGDRITEVNALNPGGAFHADRLDGTDLADRIVARLCADANPSDFGTNTWDLLAP